MKISAEIEIHLQGHHVIQLALIFYLMHRKIIREGGNGANEVRRMFESVALHYFRAVCHSLTFIVPHDNLSLASFFLPIVMKWYALYLELSFLQIGLIW